MTLKYKTEKIGDENTLISESFDKMKCEKQKSNFIKKLKLSAS